AQQLQNDWAAAGKGSVAFDLGGAQSEWVQLRPEYMGNPGLLNILVRQAIAHSLDRQALNDGVFDGRGTMAESIVPPIEPFYSDVNAAVAHYPLDLRATERLMNESGYTRGSDGIFVDNAGERFSFDHITQGEGSEFERVQDILVDGWKRAGIEVRPSVLRSAQVRSSQDRATWPGIQAYGGSRFERDWTSGEIGTPENRWTGTNRAGWSNPEYDRLYGSFLVTLDRNERTRQLVRMQQLISQELPTYFTYFSVSPMVRVAELRGPTRSASATGTFTHGRDWSWNAHEWEWTS
ncbi:MAG TPA: ABC transporter substrate-binding protein, partial [Chloroflexota bacterium]